MNKEKYIKPVMELVVFECEDVITASYTGNAPELPDMEITIDTLGLGLWD